MSFVALADFPAPAFVPRRRELRGSRRRGVGATTAQIAGSAVTTAFDAAALGLTASGVGAPIGAAVAAIGSLLGPVVAMFNGCGATCTQATTYANQAETALQQALQTYMAQPVHYASVQQATLAQMQGVFTALQNACSNPALGAAGQRCISERLIKGGTAPWCSNPGNTGCDWITGFYDPVLNDPNVVSDPQSAVSSVVTSIEGGNLLPLALVAALVVGLVMAL